MLPNANGAASARPFQRQLQPATSTLLAGFLLIATGAATPGMSQHHGHRAHEGHVASQPQRAEARTAGAKQHSGHAHAGPGARDRTGPQAPAVREFKAAHDTMMRNMAVPYTGDPDADFRIQMIPHHQGAIDMAQVAMRHAKDPWTRQLAEGVIVEQQREIAEMQAWLQRRGFASPPTRHPTHTIRANSFRTDPEEPGTRAELRGQSWAPGAGIPVRR
jgi:uncharacterized protein (DUF305 family)